MAWSGDDSAGIVLAVWHAGTIVSTMRGNVLHDRQMLEQFLECDLTHIPMSYPSLVLGKAATDHAFARRGLHSMLRYSFIHAACKCGIASIAGLVMDGAPRTRLMRRLGYEYFVPDRAWWSDFTPHAGVAVAVLPRDGFATALRTLAGEVDLAHVPESLCDEIASLTGALVRDTAATLLQESHGG